MNKYVMPAAAIGVLVLVYLASMSVEQQVQASAKNLRTYAQKLMAVSSYQIPKPPLPASDRGWHGYASSLVAEAAAVPGSPVVYKVSGVLGLAGPWRQYSQIVSGRQFQSSLDASERAAGRIKALVGHEAACVTALDTIMDYPAGQDISATDPGVLTERVKAAISGLEAVNLKLKDLAAAGDPGVTADKASVQSAIASYIQLLNAIGTANQGTAASVAMATITSAQSDIWSDRKEFTQQIDKQIQADSDQTFGRLSTMTSEL